MTESEAINALIVTAEAEDGYLEKASNASLDDKTANAGSANYTKYGRDMHQLLPSVMDFPAAWCDAFVDWCFYKTFGEANAKKMLCGNFDDYTVNSAGYYKNEGRWYTSSPQKGDQIFFKNSSGTICHTGIITKVTSSTIYTVEGNTSSASGVVANGGCVRKNKTYSIGYSFIAGFGRPKWSVVATSSSSTTSNSTTTSTTNSTATTTSTATSSTLSAGAKITLSDTKVYNTATTSTVASKKTGTYYIWSEAQTNGRIRITNSASRVGVSGQVTGWVNVSDISSTSSSSSTSFSTSTTSSSSFKVKITSTNLNIRKGPGTNYAKTGKVTGAGQFTIVETSSGTGSDSGWGLLKSYQSSRDGWVSLDYCTKVG